MGRADCFGMTDPGRVRENNEDQFLIAGLRKSMTVYSTSLGLDHQTQLFGNTSGFILMVADGMGGHPAGERASTLAVDGVADFALNALSWNLAESDPDAEFRFELEDALKHCQEIICRESSLNPGRRGMAATVTFAFIRWPRMHLVHAGDCRCYLLRENHLQTLTEDHNLLQLAEGTGSRDGRGTAARDPEATESIRSRSPVWNYVGGDCESLKPDIRELKLETGDTLLLCSDGLTRHVDDVRLSKILSVPRSARETCCALVEAANEGGGRDNITVVVAKFLKKCQDTEMAAELEIAETETANSSSGPDSAIAGADVKTTAVLHGGT